MTLSRRITIILICFLSLLGAGSVHAQLKPAARTIQHAKPQTAARTAQSAPSAHQPIRRLTLAKIPFLVLDDVGLFYGLKKSISGQSIIFSSRTTRLEFSLNSRYATLNGTRICLAFPIRKHTSLVLIAQADLYAYLEPILRPQTLPRRTVSRIVIDPGHGGKDPGCNSGNLIEKFVNYAVAYRLASLLAQRGYVVAMTRTSDTYMPLDKRVSLSRKFLPDLFISLHCNAAGTTAKGIETYVPTPTGTPASDTIIPSRKTCPASPFDTFSHLAAFYIQKSLAMNFNTTDRGLRHKRYNVINDMTAPCLLIEMGFLTNKVDRDYLGNPLQQQRLAMAIANAVDYYKKLLEPVPKKHQP